MSIEAAGTEIAPGQPIAVMPLDDVSGLVFTHLEAVMPRLRAVFERAFVTIGPATRAAQADYVRRLEEDSFFDMLHRQSDPPAGVVFRELYAHAAASCRPQQILHLCFPDRVAFALHSEHAAQFAADVQAVQAGDTPLIFQRSAAAWATHPQNYHELEGMVTRAGELLFGTSLDFGWCHLAIQAQQLGAILPHVHNRDISMVAEIPLLLREHMHARDVDWLAWEDPFILARDANELKRERERSIAETHKRLAYVIPMLQLLDATSERRQHSGAVSS